MATPPATPPRKRLVLFLDGTWKSVEDGARASNVVRMMRRVASKGPDGVPQVLFYHKGVGTGALADRLEGGATGRGLAAAIRDAYVFLGNNWEPGDEIYLFGFSRGAFTARSLAGLVGTCGLLDREGMGRLSAAWDVYRDADRTPAQVQDLGARRGVGIACIGVWDTVGALGIPLGWFNFLKERKYRFHNTSLGGHVACALQALAIDEKRFSFEPTLWQKPAGAALPPGRVVEQVWFAGCHSDIGGGLLDDPGQPHGPSGPGLADLTLEWMIERVQANTSLAFVPTWREGVAGEPLAPLHESRSLPYWPSRLVPFQRILGGWGSWAARAGSFPRRSNRPDPGNEFINESLHPSVRKRWGRIAPVLDGGRRREATYDPPNVRAAIEGGIPEAPRGQSRSVPVRVVGGRAASLAADGMGPTPPLK